MRSAPVSLSKRGLMKAGMDSILNMESVKAMEIATLGCAVHVKLSADKKTIEDVKSINKNNNKKSLDNKKVSRTITKKGKM